MVAIPSALPFIRPLQVDNEEKQIVEKVRRALERLRRVAAKALESSSSLGNGVDANKGVTKDTLDTIVAVYEEAVRPLSSSHEMHAMTSTILEEQRPHK